MKVIACNKKRIAILMLAITLMCNVMTPVIARCSEYYNQLGTAQALGSPLIDSTFDTENWNQWEMICFGVFLSNYTEPCLDDYESAFTASKQGSKGKGMEALVFGTGGDISSNNVLKTMVDFCVKAQKASNTKLTTEWCQIEKGNIKGKASSKVESTINNLIPTVGSYCILTNKKDVTSMDETGLQKLCSNIYINQCKVKGEKGGNYSEKDTSAVCSYIEYGTLPRFYAKINGKNQLVFDLTDGWDIQCMGAWLTKASSGNGSKSLVNFINDNSSLVIDCFGNICVSDGSRNVVVIPACVNQHLTKNKQYNMLNSVFLDDKFMDASENSVVHSIKSGNNNWVVAKDYIDYGLGIIDIGETKGIGDGSIFLYQDISSKINTKLKAAGYTDTSWSSVGIGDALSSMISDDLNNDTYQYPFKIQVTQNGMGAFENFRATYVQGLKLVYGLDLLDKATKSSAKLQCQNISDSIDIIQNTFPVSTSNPMLNYINTGITKDKTNKTKLFKSHYYVSPAVSSKNNSSAVKGYMNYVGKYIDSNSVKANKVLNLRTPSQLLNDIGSSKNAGEIATKLYSNSTGFTLDNTSKSIGPNDLVIEYLSDTFKAGKKNNITAIKALSLSELDNEDYFIGSKKNGEFKKNELINSTLRVAKVYTANSDMKAAMNALNIQEGTEFAVWTPYVYITYLEWYGLIGNNTTSNFSDKMFEMSSDLLKTNGEELFNGIVMTEEEKKAEVLNKTYLLLDTSSSGREYRANVASSWIEDLIARAYSKICYGSGSVSSDSYNGVTSKTTGGFLNIDTYEDNFMTSIVMKQYVRYVIALIGIFVVCVIVMGLIKGKKFSWFIVSIIMTVTLLILAPTTGEVTPYICNKIVQGMFEGDMTYWAMSEGIANASQQASLAEAEAVGADSEETVRLTRALNINNTDKAITIKSDISKKIIEGSGFDLEAIQSMQSARWLLPTIMRQYTSSDTEDYVYTPLADLFEYESALYWNYAPLDKASNESYIAKHHVEPEEKVVLNNQIVAKKQRLYKGYILAENETSSETWRSLSRVSIGGWDGNIDPVHTVSYLLDLSTGIDDPFNKYKREFEGQDRDKIDRLWADNMTNYKSNSSENTKKKQAFMDKTEEVVSSIDGFSLYTTGVRNDYGYYWLTENPAHYFYQVVKDTFNSDPTYGFNGSYQAFISELEGYYEQSDGTVSKTTEAEYESGTEVHRSIMRMSKKGSAGDGEIRDFLDLEELFTNVIPYLYMTQIEAGGTDGTDGLLGDEKLLNYGVYDNNYKSWLYRCNWVTKLVEYDMYSEPCNIKDSSGNTYTVDCPLYPQCYPDKRPMVFSAAQMKDQGLQESDLSYVELKILNINKRVERKWTSMINFANTSGVTKEIMERQMAIDAMIIFNDELSPDKYISASKALYPTTLDLRNISFDSIMKLIMISSTKSSSYIYSDTMKAVIADSDIISSALLLSDAWVCSSVIPFFRNIVLGLIFYLGAFAMIANLFSRRMNKIKIASAFAIDNIVFAVITFLYYGVFALLIKTSTADSVLQTSSISINVGVPTWKFFIILIANSFYLIASYKLLKFVLVNYRDLGFEMFTSVAGVVMGRISGAVGSLGDKLSLFGAESDDEGKSEGTGDDEIENGSAQALRKTNTENVNINATNVTINNGKGSSDSAGDGLGLNESGYTFKGEERVHTDKNNSADAINKEIEKGKDL